MAQNIDNLPVYDELVKMENGQLTNQMSGVWMSAISNLIQNLQGYLTGQGILAPQLTTAQIQAINNAVNGQIVYNTTTNKFQGYENGAWINIA